MDNKKLTVFIKTTPTSVEHVQKLNVDCNCCSYYIDEDYPLCFHGNGCAVVEQIKKTINTKDVIHNTSNTNNPSVSIIAKNTDALGYACKVINKAIEYCTGKEK